MSNATKSQKRRLVEETATTLRDRILARAPGTRIGSLREVAGSLGVGIVTIQQAARVLEHEGLLEVRRGPGGGYYGMRPDEAALERAFATYMRVHGFGYLDTLEMTTLLDCEIMPAAARCNDQTLQDALHALHERIDDCETAQDRILLETELRDVLFRIVSRPLIELLLRVTSQMFKQQPSQAIFASPEDVAAWKTGRRRILQAIIEQDEELARFEAERYRQLVLSKLRTAAGRQ